MYVIHSFGGTDGRLPHDGVIEASDGVLYGTTQWGGSSDGGTAFRLNEDGGEFSVLKSFDATLNWLDGAYPFRGVIEGLDGALYGTTDQGGSTREGTLFRLSKTGDDFTVLHDFGWGGFGSFSRAPLLTGSDGHIYGASTIGGWGNGGVVFRLSPSGEVTILESVDMEVQGHYCLDLTGGTDGFLYGTTVFDPMGNQGGAIYRVALDGTGISTLKILNGSSEGLFLTSLTEGSDGLLYGATGYGGVHNAGTVFSVRKGGQEFRSLKSFTSQTEGTIPNGILEGMDGALYGVASQGGPHGGGTIFRLNKDGSGFEVLHAFGATPDEPTAPYGRIIFTTSGRLAGTTVFGGANDSGTVWTFGIPAPSRSPSISSLSPASALAGGYAFTLTLEGDNFDETTVAFWNGDPRATTYLDRRHVLAEILTSDLVCDAEFATAMITVNNSTVTESGPAVFTIIGASTAAAVAEVESGIASADQTVSVQLLPTSTTSAGLAASIENLEGSEPVSVTVATYTENPTGNSVFDTGAGYVDVQVSGADPGDRLTARFYYPQTVTSDMEDELTLSFFNGIEWLPVLSSGGVPPVKDTTDNLDGTTSGGRFQVLFDDSSTPAITELTGTVIAMGRVPALTFAGFHSPIGGADDTGGSATAPLRTFKAGSTIPVKFTLARGLNPVSTGVHQIQVQQFSNSTTTGTAIDATPQGGATSGNQFRYADGHWIFNLDTEATGMGRGIWKVTATLSDNVQHSAWIQIK
jgi:uncharacterized repeat protein (TIGR03803 family)